MSIRIQEDLIFERWQEVINLGKIADAVVIGLQVGVTQSALHKSELTTIQDALHAAVVKAFAEQGYHIMCEKPMATSVQDCVEMLRDVTSEPMEGKIFAIGHVMRYSPYNVAIREIIDSGVLGDIVDVQVRAFHADLAECLSTQSLWATNTLLTLL